MDNATLVVSSSAAERAAYAGWLRADGFRVAEAASAAQALEHHRRTPFPVTVAEVTSPVELVGVELIRSIRDTRPQAQFLMLSSGEAIGVGVEAIKAGASDLLLQPVTREALIDGVRRLSHAPGIPSEIQRLEDELRERYNFEEIIARSPQMFHVLSIAARVAPRDTTVLITGESGTGKEVLARAIHANSRRGRKPLVAINCAAIPETLLESELFGYRRGAFTGAHEDKLGLLATADGGTLFLDEIAELPLPTQAKLLRFIQEGAYFPVGSPHPCTGDVRILSATNAPLLDHVEQGTFRRDLYYRLSVFPLHLPPLRERTEDIVPLAQHFLAKLEHDTGQKVPGLSREVVHYLTARTWRGNVRELQSAIVRAVILSEGSLLTSADFRRLEIEAGGGGTSRGRLWRLPDEGISLPELNRALITEALDRTKHNVSAAARLLGVTRPALRYRIKHLDRLS